MGYMVECYVGFVAYRWTVSSLWAAYLLEQRLKRHTRYSFVGIWDVNRYYRYINKTN